MDLIQVNQDKCSHSGLCAEVCPSGSIIMENQVPQATERNCIACGHCVAVCPVGAMDNVKAPLARQLPLENVPVLDADTVARFLRSRRSIRR